MMKYRFWKVIAITLISCLIGVLLIRTAYLQQVNRPVELDNELVTHNPSNPATDLQTIIHETQKNVVQINVETSTNERIGSGFLYNTRGDFITNAHVIEDAKTITVTMSNAETYPAAIVGIGEDNDIAVIRVPQLIGEKPMAIETNELLSIGAEVIAIGSPLGFQNSVSLGIISGINRSFEIDDFSYENVYQISANITHGNSGGPLIDRETGKVIGINSAGIDDSGIGFSIPIQAVIDEVRNWSSAVSNDDLIYPSYTRTHSIDAETMQDDADYLIGYFFESIEMRDYLNAYSLLGSQQQSEHDYPSFRSTFVDYKALTVEEIESHFIESKNQVQIEARIDITETMDDHDPKALIYTFDVGFENDQLKIIDYTVSSPS